MLKSSVTRIALFAIASFGLLPSNAQAGPLLDWLFGRHRSAPAYAVGQPVPVGTAAAYGSYPAGYGGYAVNYGNYYGSRLPVIGPAGAGYSAAAPSGITAATQPSTLSYVPNFRSSAYRAPVTYYRPLLTTDPNTGAQVVAMAPCTSYQYLTQRIPTSGRRSLFGSRNLPAILPAPQALPTYTLPSGGIPLAGTVTTPYTAGYGYSALQPPVTGAYPTAPLGTSPYYGTTTGGSCGGYVNPAVPGLVAPQAPLGGQPALGTTPGYPAPSAQAPPANSVFPPPNAPSSDPAANAQPSLPPIQGSTSRNPRPQVQSIVRRPGLQENPSPQNMTPRTSSERFERPSVSPIPAPEGFEHPPRWSPGLLKDQDMTALRPIAPQSAQFSGQSKRIHWASFEQPRSAAKVPVPAAQPSGRLRPINPPQTPTTQPMAAPPSRRYDPTGWKASR